MRLSHSWNVISHRIEVMPAPVLKRRITLCIALTKIYKIQCLYVDLDLRASSVGVAADSNGSRLSAIVRFRFVVDDCLCGWLNSKHSCETPGLSAAGLRWMQHATLQAICIASGVCCTSSGRDSLLMALAVEPSYFIFSEPSCSFAPFSWRLFIVQRRKNLGIHDFETSCFHCLGVNLEFSVGN